MRYLSCMANWKKMLTESILSAFFLVACFMMQELKFNDFLMSFKNL